MANITPDYDDITAVRAAESLLRLRIEEARAPLDRRSNMYKRLTRLMEQARDVSHALDPIEEAAAGVPQHLRQGKPAPPEGWPYGATHDNDCPACVASGASYNASPRSEAYWSS